MRDILFKAKRLDNGKWVEGLIGHPHVTDTEKGVKSYYFHAKDEMNFWSQCAVSAEAICQFTGLTDKNGNKIWENDIVKDTNIHLLGSVEYDEEHGMYVINEVNDGYQNFQEFWSCTEVIGNIFDNPELINRTDF